MIYHFLCTIIGGIILANMITSFKKSPVKYD